VAAERLQVLLVHGLGRTPLSFRTLGRSLRSWGFAPECFGYLAAAERYDRVVGRLARRIDRVAGAGEYALVTHSLGALLARDALARVRCRLPRRVVMLAPPNRLPRMAAVLHRVPPYRWLLGECGTRLASAEFFSGLPSLTVPYTIIAGSAGPRWKWLPLAGTVNDGIVALDETRLRTDDVVLAVPAGHTFIMRHPEVQAMIRWTLGSPAAP
jgi:hypothetical protein